MTLRHLGRVEAADLIMQGVATSAAALEVTFDLGCEISDCSGGEQRMLTGATIPGTSVLSHAIIEYTNS